MKNKLKNFHISIQMNMKYQELIVLCSSDEEFSDSEDGITEILLPIGKQIHNSLNEDVDSLKFPAVLKNIEDFKSIFKLITTFKKSTEKIKTN